MTNKEAISNLNHIYGMVAPDIQRSLDVAIKALERPQGEWIIKPKENSQSAILICSKCNHFIPITIDKNFCPNCGADMRGEENEID